MKRTTRQYKSYYHLKKNNYAISYPISSYYHAASGVEPGNNNVMIIPFHSHLKEYKILEDKT